MDFKSGYNLVDKEINFKLNSLNIQIKAIEEEKKKLEDKKIEVNNERETSKNDLLLKEIEKTTDSLYKNPSKVTFEEKNIANVTYFNFGKESQRNEKQRITEESVSDLISGVNETLVNLINFSEKIKYYPKEVKKRINSTKDNASSIYKISDDYKRNELLNKVNNSINNIEYLVSYAEEMNKKTSQLGKEVLDNIPKMIVSLCKSPLSEFLGENGIYTKNNGDNSTIIINSKENPLLKKMYLENRLNPNQLIYMNLDRDKIEEFSNLVKKIYNPKIQEGNIRESFDNWAKENLGEMGIASLKTGVPILTLVGSIQYWGSYFSQNPIKDPQYLLLGVLAGAIGAGWNQAPKVSHVINEYINKLDLLKTQKDTINSIMKESTTNPFVISTKLASEYK